MEKAKKFISNYADRMNVKFALKSEIFSAALDRDAQNS